MVRLFVLATTALSAHVAFAEPADRFVATRTLGPGCKVRYYVEHNDADYSTRLCHAIAAFQLRVEVEDARDDVTLLPPRGAERALELHDTISGSAFSEVRGAALWLMHGWKPQALILTLYEQDESVDPPRAVPHYLVAKLGYAETCLVSDESSLRRAKLRARDAQHASCLPLRYKQP